MERTNEALKWTKVLFPDSALEMPASTPNLSVSRSFTFTYSYYGNNFTPNYRINNTQL